jgi:hypothetical protein
MNGKRDRHRDLNGKRDRHRDLGREAQDAAQRADWAPVGDFIRAAKRVSGSFAEMRALAAHHAPALAGMSDAKLVAWTEASWRAAANEAEDRA